MCIIFLIHSSHLLHNEVRTTTFALNSPATVIEKADLAMMRKKFQRTKKRSSAQSQRQREVIYKAPTYLDKKTMRIEDLKTLGVSLLTADPKLRQVVFVPGVWFNE